MVGGDVRRLSFHCRSYPARMRLHCESALDPWIHPHQPQMISFMATNTSGPGWENICICNCVWLVLVIANWHLIHGSIAQLIHRSTPNHFQIVGISFMTSHSYYKTRWWNTSISVDILTSLNSLWVFYFKNLMFGLFSQLIFWTSLHCVFSHVLLQNACM